MKPLGCVIAGILLCLVLGDIAAQERGFLLSKYYSNNDYGAGLQVFSAVEDSRGVMYFANVDGVLEYDGETWKTYRVSNGSVVRSLATAASGAIYVGAFGEMGVMSVDARGMMFYESLMDLVDSRYRNFMDVWCTHCIGDTVFFLSDNCLFRFANGKFDYYPKTSEGYYLAFMVDGGYYVHEMGRGLMKFTDGELVPISRGGGFAHKRVHGLFPYNGKFLVGTRKSGFFILDTAQHQTPIVQLSRISRKSATVNDYFIRNHYYCGIVLPNGYLALSSVLGDILIVDRNWNVVDIIGRDTKSNESMAIALYLQKNNLMWMGLDNGICQVEVMSNLRYWNEKLGVNGIIGDIARNNGYLYISTSNGVFYTPTRGGGEDFDFTRFVRMDEKFEDANFFLKYRIHPNWNKSHSQTGLLLASTNGVYQIGGTSAQRISCYENAKRLVPYGGDTTRVLVTYAGGVGLLSYSNGQWIEGGSQFGISDEVYDVAVDSAGNIWITTNQKGAYRVRNPFAAEKSKVIVERYDSTAGYPQNEAILISDDLQFYQDDHRYFVFNDSLDRFEAQGNISTNGQYSPIEKIQHGSSHDSPLAQDARIRCELNRISSMYVENKGDSSFWYSTAEGVFRFGASPTVQDTGFIPPTLIRMVQADDTVLFFGTNPKKIGDGFVVDTGTMVDIGTVVNYKHNSLIFHYACPYYERENKVEYSYKLVGFDKKWSEWTSESKKEYTNLNEGNYVFMVKARHMKRYESKRTGFKFIVTPPWYRTVWACALYTLVFIIIALAIVRINTYRLLKEKDRLEDLVKLRTQEILVQKDEILVQAGHLRQTNEWIVQKNNELTEQKRELENKTEELEASNATRNRLFRIIAHDLRNPVSMLVTSTSYIISEFDNLDREGVIQILGNLNRLTHTSHFLLENLLDWATSQMGGIKYSPKRISPRVLIDENLELIQPKLTAKNIAVRVNVSDDIFVNVDENTINSVIRNLLTNAAKFTGNDGLISIYASVDTSFCHINFEDNGVGISEENLTKLFSLESGLVTYGTNKEKGSGLGLVLCKDFIEHNGGSIRVRSTLGKGSVFTISIPLA